MCMLCRFFLGSHTSVRDAEVAATVADLLAAGKGHTRSLIPKLHKLYCGATDSQLIPPMTLLQHPKVAPPSELPPPLPTHLNWSTS